MKATSKSKELLKDKHFEERGYYSLKKMCYNSWRHMPSLDFPVVFKKETFYPGGKDAYDKRQSKGSAVKDWNWIWSKEKFQWGIENDFLEIKDGEIFKKDYEKIKIGSKGKKYWIEIKK